MPVIMPREPEKNIVLVCGGRDYKDVEHVFRILDGLHKAKPIERIIQGGADGADLCARAWAIARAVPKSTYFANWQAEGRKAGPLRNQRMIDEGKPGLVVAFPGGRGTADMLRRAKTAGVDWMTCSRDSDGTATAAVCKDIPVPKDCQARAEKHRPTPVLLTQEQTMGAVEERDRREITRMIIKWRAFKRAFSLRALLDRLPSLPDTRE